MSKTVVGLFESGSVAESIKKALVSEGYLPNDIRVVANGESYGSAAGETSSSAPHTTTTGLGATISNFFRSLTGGDEEEQRYTQGVQNGGVMLSVVVPDGQESDVVELLESHGARDVDTEQSQVSTATATSTQTAVGRVSDGTANMAVPIVEEELAVGKRQVQRGGVRVYSHMVETPVEQNIELHEEHVRVDRQNVNRPATEADFAGFQEGTTELTETVEEAVVGKRARVVEEITIGKQTSQHTETIRDTVRHTEVEVEKVDGTNSATDYDASRSKSSANSNS